MLHACDQRFDVTENFENFCGYVRTTSPHTFSFFPPLPEMDRVRTTLHSSYHRGERSKIPCIGQPPARLACIAREGTLHSAQLSWLVLAVGHGRAQPRSTDHSVSTLLTSFSCAVVDPLLINGVLIASCIILYWMQSKG